MSATQFETFQEIGDFDFSLVRRGLNPRKSWNCSSELWFALKPLNRHGPSSFTSNSRIGRIFSDSSWGCRNLQFWCINNFGTRLGGSSAPKSVSKPIVFKCSGESQNSQFWCTSSSGTRLGGWMSSHIGSSIGCAFSDSSSEESSSFLDMQLVGHAGQCNTYGSHEAEPQHRSKVRLCVVAPCLMSCNHRGCSSCSRESRHSRKKERPKDQASLDGPIRANRFADSRTSPDSCKSSQGFLTGPLFFSKPQGITQKGVHTHPLTAREREHWTLQHLS